MRKVWVCIAENARWKTGVFSEYIPAILLCIALSLHPNSGHALYVQYKRVSSMFLNVLFYMGKLRLVWFLIAENEHWKILLAGLFYLEKVRKVCVCIVENARWKMGVLFEIIAAILQFTA